MSPRTNGKTTSVRHQVASGAAMLTAARMLSRIVDMATLVVLARHLTAADFGLVAIALSMVQIAEAILELPTGLALLQLRTITRRHLDTTFTLNLLRGVVLMATLCALAVPASIFFNDSRLIPLICTLSLAPALRGLRSPKMAQLFKHLRFRPDAIAEVVGKVAALGIATSLALATGSYWAIAAGTIASPLFYVVATYIQAPARPRLSMVHWRAFHRYVGWTMGAQAMSALNWQVDRFVLGKLASQATVGLFATTRDLAATTHKIIFDSIQRPLLAAFSRSNAQPERQREVYGQSIATVLSIGLPIACGQALLAPELVRLILGPHWLAATIVFQAVSLSLIPGFYSSLTTTLLFASGHPEFVFSRNMWDLSFRIPATVACIVLFGWQGAVVALIAADVFLAVMCLFVARRTIGIGVIGQVARAWRGAVSVAIMVAVVLLMRKLVGHGDTTLQLIGYIALVVPVAATSYVGMHCAVWLASGRPEGIERLCMELIAKAAGHLSARRGAGRKLLRTSP